MRVQLWLQLETNEKPCYGTADVHSSGCYGPRGTHFKPSRCVPVRRSPLLLQHGRLGALA